MFWICCATAILFLVFTVISYSWPRFCIKTKFTNLYEKDRACHSNTLVSNLKSIQNHHKTMTSIHHRERKMFALPIQHRLDDLE